MRFTRCLAGIVALGLSVQVLAGPSLTPHTAEYKVRISVISGQLNTELRRTEKGYIAHHVIRPTGMARIITRGTMDVTSEFDDLPDGVKPVRFQAVDTIRDDPDVDLSFDWTNNEAVGTVGDEHVRLQLDGIAHDSVSIRQAANSQCHKCWREGGKDESRRIHGGRNSASKRRFVANDHTLVCGRTRLFARHYRATSKRQTEFSSGASEVLA